LTVHRALRRVRLPRIQTEPIPNRHLSPQGARRITSSPRPTTASTPRSNSSSLCSRAAACSCSFQSPSFRRGPRTHLRVLLAHACGATAVCHASSSLDRRHARLPALASDRAGRLDAVVADFELPRLQGEGGFPTCCPVRVTHRSSSTYSSCRVRTRSPFSVRTPYARALALSDVQKISKGP